jgi:23S rRNA-/tRNA-specific pseudouridylate synthase
VTVDGQIVWLESWTVDDDAVVCLDGVSLTITDDPAVEWDKSWVLFADDRFVVVNKPAGLRAEPRGPSDRTDLLTSARSIFGPTLVAATRLDRDTSGVMILSLPGPHRAQFDASLRAHTVTKQYVAVVSDVDRLADSGVLAWRIGPDPDRREARVVVERGGESATTRFTVLSRDTGRVLLEPQSGRTHQLRVHMAFVGAPIIGDTLYGGAFAPRLMLHAWKYAVPTLGLDVCAPLPELF